MHPNELLFPQGNFDIAYAAYKDNIVNRSINRILHNEVLEIIKQQKKKKIRILEVGAGVGGSSIELLSKIQSCNVEYYFTDISNFFFNKAKVIFHNIMIGFDTKSMILINRIGNKDLKMRNLILYYVEMFCIMLLILKKVSII